jgi:flagellar protein FlaF
MGSSNQIGEAIARYGALQQVIDSPRSLEARALLHVAAQLESADCAVARIEALHRNLRLWAVLEADLLHPGNGLPPALKTSLLALAAYTRRTSLDAMADSRPLTDLAELNRSLAITDAPAQQPAPSLAA